jgi:hypothetical protein
MFKAEIKENAPFSAAWAHSEWCGDTWDNLKPVFEVVGATNSRAEEKGARPLRGLRRSHLLTAVEHCL